MSPLTNVVHLTDAAARRTAAEAQSVAADAPLIWFPVKVGDAWRLGRNHDCGDERDPGFFWGGNPRPLQLNLAQAKALAEALNRRRLPPRTKF